MPPFDGSPYSVFPLRFGPQPHFVPLLYSITPVGLCHFAAVVIFAVVLRPRSNLLSQSVQFGHGRPVLPATALSGT